MSINRGEILGVVGGSGSGKSTLGRILAGLEPPSSGCTLAGRSANPLWLSLFRQSSPHPVQMVFQDPYDALNSVRSIRQHLEPVAQRVGNADVDWVMNAVGFSPDLLIDILTSSLVVNGSVWHLPEPYWHNQ